MKNPKWIGLAVLGMVGFGCGDPVELTAYEAMTNVFEESCGAGCHTNGSDSGELSLDASVAAMSLVDMPADGDSSWMRVVCGDVGSSALYQKLFDPPPFGDPMPLGIGLASEDVAKIKAWIESDECG
jgi:hypothetical protein